MVICWRLKHIFILSNTKCREPGKIKGTAAKSKRMKYIKTNECLTIWNVWHSLCHCVRAFTLLLDYYWTHTQALKSTDNIWLMYYGGLRLQFPQLCQSSSDIITVHLAAAALFALWTAVAEHGGVRAQRACFLSASVWVRVSHSLLHCTWNQRVSLHCIIPDAQQCRRLIDMRQIPH